MPTYRSWDAFATAAHKLQADSPKSTRFCVRYKHAQALLALRITDDKQCLVFNARSAVFLNRFDALTRSLMGKMINAPPPSVPTAAVPPQSVPRSARPAGGQSLGGPPGSELGASEKAVPGSEAPKGGGKKKKKGKKK